MSPPGIQSATFTVQACALDHMVTLVVHELWFKFLHYLSIKITSTRGNTYVKLILVKCVLELIVGQFLNLHFFLLM